VKYVRRNNAQINSARLMKAFSFASGIIVIKIRGIETARARSYNQRTDEISFSFFFSYFFSPAARDRRQQVSTSRSREREIPKKRETAGRYGYRIWRWIGSFLLQEMRLAS